jgi:uncharacterized membrane protein YhfC
LYGLLIAWGIITAVLICVLVYRSTLETHEDDQIFLSGGEETMAREQQLLVSRILKLSRPVTTLFVISGFLLVVTAGLWLWQAVKNF